jgi:hypothetical protein
MRGAGPEPTTEDLGRFLDLTQEQIAHLILCLMVEELLQDRLSVFRQNLPAKPVQRLEELGV